MLAGVVAGGHEGSDPAKLLAAQVIFIFFTLIQLQQNTGYLRNLDLSFYDGAVFKKIELSGVNSWHLPNIHIF